jgi:3-oxoacyl-[acyl-carrier-protein] synthase II
VRDAGEVAVTGLAAMTAFGRGVAPLLAAAWAGRSAFGPIDRFDVTGRRVRVAATAPGRPDLTAELAAAVRAASVHAGLTAQELAGTQLLLAVHGHPGLARAPQGQHRRFGAAGFAAEVAAAAGTAPALRTYTSACVAASTAVADAAATVTGRARTGAGPARLIVAAGYLVEPDQFALFDAGRALADDGAVRPFSAGRKGLLLGDGVAAVVLEARAALRQRNGEPLAWLRGWARTGDAYHVCHPRPDGTGLARAIEGALARARLPADEVGYVNAHGSGSVRGDAAEAAALHRAFGPAAGKVPVSSTKSVHGQALEASGLIELVVTVEALRRGRLPVNAGFLGPDHDCRLDVIVDGPRENRPRYALSLNAAFGGANTALLVGTP